MLVVMNTDDEDVDLGLTLGSTNYRTQTRLSNSSGAGVNAGSRPDIAFAASDPLTELVWSPHKGLRLKCANSSSADREPFPRDMGPNSKGNGDNKVVDQGNLDDKLGYKATSVVPSRSFTTSELGKCHAGDDERSDILLEDSRTKDTGQEGKDYMEDGEDNLCHPQNFKIADIPETRQENAGLNTLADRTSDYQVDMAIRGLFPTKFIGKTHCDRSSNIELHASCRDTIGLDVDHCETLAEKISGTDYFHLPNTESQKGTADEATSATEMNENKTSMSLPIPAPPLKKLESSTENDLCHLTTKEACSSGETKIPMGNYPTVERSPINSRICLYQDEGKERALSDGEIYGGSLNEEDDSHESAASCDSAGLFSKGKKRQGYALERIIGKKRMKKQILECPGSTSVARPDSSFVKWVSNMVKGLSEYNKEDSPSLALTLACSNDVCGKNRQECFTDSNTCDSANQHMGFQTVFQSLYCRNTNLSNVGAQEENAFTDGSGEPMVAEETLLGNLPGSCDRNTDHSGKQIVVPNEDVNPDTKIQPSKPWIFSSELAEDKDSDSLKCNRAQYEEKASADIPLEMNDVPEKINPHNSLWITCFSMRDPRLEKGTEMPRETSDCSIDCSKVNLDSRMRDVVDQKSSEAGDDCADNLVCASEKDINRFTASSEALTNLKSTNKMRQIVPSQRFRSSSEAMASVFARRLDAFRHIIPSRGRNFSDFSLTCFFCGSGHNLRECPYVAETELEDLLVKTSSIGRAEESSFLCIRCFQSDHWAISCPLEPSSGHFRSQHNASVIRRYTACHLHLYAGNEKCSSHHMGEEDHMTIAADHTPCSSRKSLLDSFPSCNTWDVNKSSSKMLAAPNEKRDILQCNLIPEQNTVAPLEILHAIRNLRLSRGDVLRWMNSDVPLSHLNGFFLRLRLGKLEAGQGETSYYVACITGDARAQENDDCKSKKSILVNVGGVKSSVGSQYISNHDFLEDEIKAWWCRTVKSGCRIPSLNELNSKFNHRKNLCF